MRHPPYHLRVNKAVDRAALVEAIGLLVDGESIAHYRYYGMGGPFLEEYRLLYELYPELRLVSIEANAETYKRQQFHRPCSDQVLDLRQDSFKSFLSTYEPKDERSIVWADYTDLKYEYIDNFIVLLRKLATGSMIKVTLRADARRYQCNEARADFREEFDEVLADSAAIPAGSPQFATLVQEMMLTATEQALEGMQERKFQPVSAMYYRDTVGMYTLTGVVCSAGGAAEVRKKFSGWQFANFGWAAPERVELPELTTRERHHLQTMLPCDEDAGAMLQERLGYLIDTKKKGSQRMLGQWARYHRYAVTFVRADP